MNRAAWIFAALLALALPLSLLAGRVWLDPWSTPNAAVILMELRLPRGVLAIVVGAGLGSAGAAMQGLDPRHKFREMKGFDEVIIAPGLQPFHDVVTLRFWVKLIKDMPTRIDAREHVDSSPVPPGHFFARAAVWTVA